MTLRSLAFVLTVVASTPPSVAEEFSDTALGAKIVYYESGGLNVPNFRYDRKHTAGGVCQMTKTNWERIAPTIDIDIVKFPNAGSASWHQQNQACWKLLETDGVNPWTCCNKDLKAYLAEHPVAAVPFPGERARTAAARTQTESVEPVRPESYRSPFIHPGPTPGNLVFSIKEAR
jgi:hypothetical protein